MMIYYRNRLIHSYFRVGLQLQRNTRGEGIIGIQEANFLTPKHNKQAFSNNELWNHNEKLLGKCLKKYWITYFEKNTFQVMKDLDVAVEKNTNEKWMQCDKCLKWRKVPPGYTCNNVFWYCSQNPNSARNACTAPEESYGGEDEVILSLKDTEDEPELPSKNLQMTQKKTKRKNCLTNH